jgi:Xaa-Pro dipeptidase
LEAGTAAALSWAQHHHLYPVHDVSSDEVVGAIASVLNEMGFQDSKIGCEFSVTPRVGLSPNQWQQLKQASPKTHFEDGAPVLWSVRKIKSPLEVESLRTAAHIVSDMFDDLPTWMRADMTEDQVYRGVSARLILKGAEKPGYIAAYSNIAAPIVHWPTQRKYERGNVGLIDAGALSRGYWSDFDRHVAMGKVDPRAEDAVRAMWDVEQACIEAVRPGNTVADIYRAYRTATAGFKSASTTNILGRIGHGIGLDQVEHISLFADNEMPLEPGMTMCVEPSFVFEGVGLVIAEEMVAVSETGYDMLSRRGPRGTIAIDG